jgi:hypothetical protein
LASDPSERLRIKKFPERELAKAAATTHELFQPTTRSKAISTSSFNVFIKLESRAERQVIEIRAHNFETCSALGLTDPHALMTIITKWDPPDREFRRRI